MAIIKVDLDEIINTYNEIEKQINIIDTELDSQKKKIENLKDTWQGEDYDEFMKKWLKFKENEKNLKSDFENYNKYLKGYYDDVVKVRKSLLTMAGKLPTN